MPTVDVIQPKQGAPHQEIVLPGNIQAFTDAPIYARTNGYLKKWYVDIGARVKAGQLLAVIDTPEVDQQLHAGSRGPEYRRGQQQSCRRSLGNATRTSKTPIPSPSRTSTTPTVTTRPKKPRRTSSAANVKRLEDTKAFQNIYAPFRWRHHRARYRHRPVDRLPGSSTTQKELFHIAAINTLRVFINVPQQYSIAAKPGLTADLTLGEYPGRRFQGTLVRTANAIDLASRTLLVEVDVNNASGELLPGAYTEVHLKLPNDVPTYILPVSSLIFRAQGLQVATVDSKIKPSSSPSPSAATLARKSKSSPA